MRSSTSIVAHVGVHIAFRAPWGHPISPVSSTRALGHPSLQRAVQRLAYRCQPAWRPDLLVLTGLNNILDRMKQLTAYARTLNPRIVVAAGGPPVRALPILSRRFFDYACTGDLEQLGEVVRDASVQTTLRERCSRASTFPTAVDVSVTSSRAGTATFAAASARDRRGRSVPYLRSEFRPARSSLAEKSTSCSSTIISTATTRNFSAQGELCQDLVQQRVINSWSCLVTGDFFGDPKISTSSSEPAASSSSAEWNPSANRHCRDTTSATILSFHKWK